MGGRAGARTRSRAGGVESVRQYNVYLMPTQTTGVVVEAESEQEAATAAAKRTQMSGRWLVVTEGGPFEVEEIKTYRIAEPPF